MKLERKTLFRIGGALLLLFLLIYYWGTLNGLALGLLSAAMPLLAGILIAYVLNILMGFYERHYFPKRKTGPAAASRRGVCMLLAFASLILIVVGIVVLILPELSSSFRLLGNEIPVAWNNAVLWIENHVTPEQLVTLEAMVGDLSGNFNWSEMLQKASDWLMTGFGGVAVVISRAFSATITVVVGVIFSIYLLYSKEKLLGQVGRVSRHYMKPKWYCRLRYVAGVVDDSFHRFIVGQCLESVILGVLCIVGMTLLRFPYATMIGTLVGFMALIPIAGAYIGAFVGAFMIFTISPLKALFFLIFIVVLQQLEGNLIYPKVVGASIGLPSIWVLAAITVGGGLLGIGGMLLGVPVAAALYQLLRDDMNEGVMRAAPKAPKTPSVPPKPPEKEPGEG